MTLHEIMFWTLWTCLLNVCSCSHFYLLDIRLIILYINCSRLFDLLLLLFILCFHIFLQYFVFRIISKKAKQIFFKNKLKLQFSMLDAIMNHYLFICDVVFNNKTSGHDRYILKQCSFANAPTLSCLSLSVDYMNASYADYWTIYSNKTLFFFSYFPHFVNFTISTTLFWSNWNISIITGYLDICHLLLYRY